MVTVTWESVYDALDELIIKDFTKIYGRKPSDDELNDIILDGSWDVTMKEYRELKESGHRLKLKRLM